LIGLRLNAPRMTKVNLYLDNKPLEPIDYDLGLYDSGDIYEVSTGSIMSGQNAVLFEDGMAFSFARFAAAGAVVSASSGDILSPMPGKVIAVEVSAGQSVTKGQKLLTLEAMKMEHSLTAPFDGTIVELNAEPGGQVSEGTLLVQVKASGT
jgi:3-methylcrotonyl-CoA carboxylase alpha subunit